MSHLLKDNLKKYFIILKISIIILLLFLFYNGFINYNGNKIIYVVFSIVSNFLIYFSFRKNALFFETFFALLLWLGFWFKFTNTISFTDGVFREGVGMFNYSVNSFNETLIISTIGLVAFIMGGYFREFFLFRYPQKLYFNFNKNNFFIKNRNKIWLIFTILFLYIAASNFYLKIYQKGLLPVENFNFIFSGTYKWLLLFGLSSISSIIIFFEINILKKFLFTSSLIIFFEIFFSAFSMLSRGMIFNAFAILFGIYKFTKKINNHQKLSSYFKSIITISVLFYISVASVNYIRSNYFYVGKSADFAKEMIQKALPDDDGQIKKIEKYNTIASHHSEFTYLLINRWVGIDGVMSVISKKEILNLDLLKDSFNERANSETPTFYEMKFGLENIKNYRETKKKQLYSNVKGNTLPGLIAVSFYAGSYYLLFFIIFLITIFASSIEYFAFRFSNKNLIFSALIGQIIAFRFIHFGYLPHQSYLLFGTILITILLIYLFGLIIGKTKQIN